MPNLSVTKTYADGSILAEQDLDNVRTSIQTWANNTKLDQDNIQAGGIATANIAAGAITASLIATGAVGTTQIADTAVTSAKLAAAIAAAIPASGDYKISAQAADHSGWLICDGRAASRATYADLFALVGTKFGSGDGSTTFNLPKQNGYFLRFPDHGAGVDPDAASRTAMASGGATGDNIGSVQSDAYRVHSHTYAELVGGSSSGDGAAGSNKQLQTTATSADGGSETRPVNAYFGNLFIKT